MSCDSLLCGKGRFYMKKYENFCSALCNMKEIYKYDPPYDTVILTGLVGLFEVCFEQSWKAMKEILEINGYAEGAAGSPKTILKTAFKAEMIDDECKFRINGAPFSRQRCKRLAPAVRYPFIACL